MPRKLLGGADLNSQRAIHAADPSASDDLATKAYVDNLVNGLAWKAPVRAATTTNGTLATAYANGQTIDGVSLATGDRILLKDQTAGADNGVYTVNASGAPTRAVDMDSAAETKSATVFVQSGTANADKAFTQTADSVTLGTTSLVWAQVGGGTTYTSGSGAIGIAGSAVSFVPKSGGFLAQDGSGAYLDTTAAAAKLVTKYAANIGDGSTTAITVTHNLGTKDRLGEPLVFVVSTGEQVDCDIIIGTNSDTVTFPSAPSSGQYRYSTAA